MSFWLKQFTQDKAINNPIVHYIVDWKKQDLKTNFDDLLNSFINNDVKSHNVLSIGACKENKISWHTVTPTIICNSADDKDIWKIYVYDSNEPKNKAAIITINRKNNSWVYNINNDYNGLKHGFILCPDPSENYIPSARNKSTKHKQSIVEIYCNPFQSISIKGTNGNIVGHNSIDGSIMYEDNDEIYPVIIPADKYLPPVAYYSKQPVFSIGLKEVEKDSNYVSILSDSIYTRYTRKNVIKSDVDSVYFNSNGMTIVNRQEKNKNINMLLQKFTKGAPEYEITNFVLNNDSVSFAIDNNSLIIRSKDNKTTYDIQLSFCNHDDKVVKKFTGVSIGSNSKQIITPEFVGNDTIIKISNDINSDGVIDNTLVLSNKNDNSLKINDEIVFYISPNPANDNIKLKLQSFFSDVS